MKKLSIKNALYLIIAILFFGFSNAQVKLGTNPTSINPSSILEIESSNKGLLLPRVALTSTTLASPLNAHVAGMTVYNTATAGTAPNNVVPGVYCNNGTSWVASSTSISGADATDDAWVNNPTAGRVELGTTSTGAARASNGSAKFGISDAGRVGIGTDPNAVIDLSIAHSSPAGLALQLAPRDITVPTGVSRLRILNDQTKALNFGMTNSQGSFAGVSVTENTAFLLTSGLDTKLTFGTDNRPKMTIFADGKMGIGTIFPNQAATADLDVNGSLRIRGIALSTDFTGKNILLTDASGNVSQITTQNFVSQLGIPSIVLAGKSATTSVVQNDLVKHNLNLSTININIGTGWDATNRTYTVPGDGYYEIYASSEFTPLNSDVRIRLVLETSGSSSQKIYLSSADPMSTVPGVASNLSGTANLSLVTGDVVSVYLEAGYNNGSAPNTYQISNQLSTITRKTYN